MFNGFISNYDSDTFYLLNFYFFIFTLLTYFIRTSVNYFYFIGFISLISGSVFNVLSFIYFFYLYGSDSAINGEDYC